MDQHKTFRDLVAWQESHACVLLTYKITGLFPEHEKFGLVSQWRRAAVSVSANIVEGYARPSHVERLRFLDISKGSLAECEYFVLLAKDLGYLSSDQAEQVEVQRKKAARLLMGLVRSLRSKRP